MLNGPAPPYQRINASHRKRPEPNCTQSILTIGSPQSTERDTLKFAEIQDLVALGGGFVWSSANFHSELARVVNHGQQSQNQ